MPSPLRYLPAVAAAALLLAACDPRFVRSSNLKPAEVQALTGVWQGKGSLTFGSANGCPRVYLWTLRVGGGNVDGELVDSETPKATPARFSTFLDYDGSLHVSIRPNDRELDVIGSFDRNSFSGTARGPLCGYSVQARRVEGKP